MFVNFPNSKETSWHHQHHQQCPSISKVDLNGQYLAIPFNFEYQNSPPWPSRIIPHGQLHPTCRWSNKNLLETCDGIFPDVHTSNHAIGTTATFTKIPTQYQAAWVNESPCAKVFKKKRKKTLADLTSWSSAKKRSKTLGVPQFAAQKTSNSRKSEPFVLVMSARLKLGRLWFGTFCPSTFCTLAQRPPCPRCT